MCLVVEYCVCKNFDMYMYVLVITSGSDVAGLYTTPRDRSPRESVYKLQHHNYKDVTYFVYSQLLGGVAACTPN